jgi:hypothetical protein
MLIVGAGGLGYYGQDMLHAAPSLASRLKSGCNIKGNVSIDTGERIYHVPGQKYYARTIIRPEFGEQWFCTEAEARHAGWRKSKI